MKELSKNLGLILLGLITILTFPVWILVFVCWQIGKLLYDLFK